MKDENSVDFYLEKVILPSRDSHKGQNGKLLIIGGSNLFHAASKWSLDIASKFVDMVFYSSIPTNNQLVKEAKGEFWNGIVVPRAEIANYFRESDCVLIGPGMERDDKTAEIVNSFLRKYSDKKWVVDAGALQMVEPDLLNQRCIVTPHEKELQRLLGKGKSQEQVLEAGVTILLKGKTDKVLQGGEVIEIPGGNAGMTKGGTGDVLSGLVAALYCSHDSLTSAVVASYVNKKAGEALYSKVGPYFNASDLVDEVPKVMWDAIKG